MRETMPRTPFSTHLSGSARETELRLRNIFSGPKKRPPVLFLALIFAACLLCGNLVSCQVAEAEREGSPESPGNSRQGDVSLPDYTARAVPIDPDAPPQTEEEEWLLQALFTDADMLLPFQEPKARLMDCIQNDGYILGAALVEDHLENTLVLGVMDRETRKLAGAVFRRSLHAGVLNTVAFQSNDGEYRLLYTFNGQENGQYTGQAGVVRLDGAFMAWEWPAEGDAGLVNDPPAGPKGAFNEYEAYWDCHLALLAPGGVDVYTVNPDFEWGKEEPASMWQADHGETFYADPGSAEELPMPVYFQSLNWLAEHTNDPGGWQVVSLTLNEERCDPEARTDCFTLRAKFWNGAEELTADLFFPYESEPPMRPRIYEGLDYAEVQADICELPLAPEADT